MKHWHVVYRIPSYNCKYSRNVTKPEPYIGCDHKPWHHWTKKEIPPCTYKSCPLEKTKVFFDKKYEVPTEEISCPVCDDRYGRYNKKVCSNCAECSKCCQCNSKDLVSAIFFIEDYLGYTP